MMSRTLTFAILLSFVLYGCSPNVNDQARLIVAVTNNQPSKVEELIASANVDINSINDNVGPVLCLAAYIGHDEIIEILLRHGAEVNIRDNRSSTPLMNATLGDHESTVKLLLASGADPSLVIQNKNGEPTSMTALGIAKMRGNQKTIVLEKAQHF
jgi:ankyrin repeat protein